MPAPVITSNRVYSNSSCIRNIWWQRFSFSIHHISWERQVSAWPLQSLAPDNRCHHIALSNGSMAILCQFQFLTLRVLVPTHAAKSLLVFATARGPSTGMRIHTDCFISGSVSHLEFFQKDVQLESLKLSALTKSYIQFFFMRYYF